MAIVDSIGRLIAPLTLALSTFLAASAAFGQTLPVIVDATAPVPSGWWLPDAEAHTSPLDEALFAHGARFVSPNLTQPDAPPSSLLRRIDITANNARSLAGLYGADRVVVGRLEQTGAVSQPWLGLQRVGLRLTGELLDVASGASIATLDLSAAAYHPDVDRATRLATQAIATRIAAVVPTEVAGVPAAPASDGFVILVQSWETAAPYVALRGALREAHPAVLEVIEVWATEGQVALELRLDEGADEAAVRNAITRLEGTDVDGARVRRVDFDANVGTIVVIPAPLPDAPPAIAPAM